MPLVSSQNASDKIPKLLRAYLAVGAKICGPPAIDPEFKTIDFLTLMDLQALHPRVYARFLKFDDPRGPVSCRSAFPARTQDATGPDPLQTRECNDCWL